MLNNPKDKKDEAKTSTFILNISNRPHNVLVERKNQNISGCNFEHVAHRL